MPDREYTVPITVEDGGLVLIKTAPQKHLKDPFLRIFEMELLTVVTDPEMTGTDFRVLFWILGNMEFENYFKHSQGRIAEKLGTKQPEVSKSIKKLIAKGWLKIEGQIGRQNIYRVNPRLALKSRSQNHKTMVTDWDLEQAIAKES